MNSFSTVEKLLAKQSYPTIEKKPEHRLEAEVILLEYGVKKDSGFFKLYTKYFLSALDHRYGASEIVDPLPTRSFILRVKFAHEVWEVPKNYAYCEPIRRSHCFGTLYRNLTASVKHKFNNH